MITRSFLASVVMIAFSLPGCAQANLQGGPQPGYRLQANSRVVLTDVTVTDAHGKPVRGLKLSDFRIFDNGKPQQVASFEEHRDRDSAPAAPLVLAPGIYSNDYLAHPPRVLNIIFLDLTNISIEDQMYLRYQLDKFIDALNPGDPVAIYARTGDATILLQGFTSDRALLRAAVHKVVPRFPPFGREYLSDLQTLQQMEMYLGQIPGRKNVLWFSGGSTLFLRPDATLFASQEGTRDVYDELEAQRIAIYPIDARGLTTGVPPEMPAQHAVMSDVAEATGGHAVYDYNGLALAAGQIVHNDGDYYTLTYSPHAFRFDNKWHKVRVTIPGTYYTLSYRRGYFADGTNPSEERPKRSRTRLLASGETAKDPPNSREPIIFEASVHADAMALPPAAASSGAKPEKRRNGTSPFTVTYSLPLDAFAMASVGGKQTVTCGAAVIAFNDKGTVVAHRGQEVTFTLTDEAAAHPAGKLLPVDLKIDLSQGDVYLFVAAWDMASHRLGTLEIPYHADRANGPQRTPASD
jgi:VWFA-related protein